MTQQTKLSVASGGGLQRSFSIVQQGWTTSKHSPTVTPDHIVDSDTPSYPTLTPSLAAQLGDNSVSTYIFIIVALLGIQHDNCQHLYHCCYSCCVDYLLDWKEEVKAGCHCYLQIQCDKPHLEHTSRNHKGCCFHCVEAK